MSVATSAPTQQQQQQLLRPEDGELAAVLTQIEKSLTQNFLPTQETTTTETSYLSQQQEQQNHQARFPFRSAAANAFHAVTSPSTSTTNTTTTVDSIFPPLFVSTIAHHFSTEKLKLSDEAAAAVKDEGNKLFTANRFDEAVLSFTKAMLSVKSNEAYAVLLGNRSAAFLSAGMTLAAALDANVALTKLQSSTSSLPLCVKLLDRRTRCLVSLGGFEKEAEEDAEMCKKLMDVINNAKNEAGKEKAIDDDNGKTTAVVTAASISDRTSILLEKQSKVADPWIYQNLSNQQQQQPKQNQISSASLHKDLVFSFDQQALPYSATDSFRRFANLTKKFDLDEGNDAEDNILTELPTVSCVRTDALLVVCASCCQRSSALYPSEKFRQSGYRCRGLFCNEKCSEFYWSRYGQAECGVPFYMAAPAETVCALRLSKIVSDKENNFFSSLQQQGEATSTSSLFKNLPDQIRPKEIKKEQSSSTTAAAESNINNNSFKWAIEENFESNLARTKETEALNTAVFGGQESAIALLALILGNVFKSNNEAVLFLETYRKLVSFLQPLVFIDRVFHQQQQQNTGNSNNSGYATVPVTCAVGYFPVASLFNHSCDPNCQISFRGNPFSSSAQLHLRAIKPIQEGQMLTVSWGGVDKNSNHSTRSRIQSLRRLFGFSCCCSACSQNPDESISREKQEMMIKAADYYQKGRRLIRERKELNEAVTVLKQSLEILFKFVCPAPEPPIFVVAKTYDAIAQASLMLGNADQCLEYVTKRVDILEQLQGESSFEFIMELEKLSVLLKRNNNGTEKSSAVDGRTARILKRLYPDSISLRNEIDLVRK